MDFIKVQTEDKISQTAQMAKKIWHEHYDKLIGSDQVDYMLGKFQSPAAISSHIANKWLYYIICDNDQTVGYIALEPRPKDSEMLLSKYYIYKDQRGKGYGRKCMDFIESLCKKMGLETLWLTVNKHNETTIKVYEKLGFENHGSIISDIGNGFVMDDYKMLKKIKGH